MKKQQNESAMSLASALLLICHTEQAIFLVRIKCPQLERVGKRIIIVAVKLLGDRRPLKWHKI